MVEGGCCAKNPAFEGEIGRRSGCVVCNVDFFDKNIG